MGCSPWVLKELGTTEQLTLTNLVGREYKYICRGTSISCELTKFKLEKNANTLLAFFFFFEILTSNLPILVVTTKAV